MTRLERTLEEARRRLVRAERQWRAAVENALYAAEVAEVYATVLENARARYTALLEKKNGR